MIFEKALRQTLVHEGGISMDSNDTGGYTVLGIARAFNPNTPLWSYVDDLLARDQKHILEELVLDIMQYARGKKDTPMPHNGLWELVREFYMVEFWQWLNCESVAKYSEGIAIELFDTSVNCGRNKGAKILQESLNLLNRNQLDYEDIIVDGFIGDKTVATLKKAILKMNKKTILQVMNHLQGEHYIKLMRADPSRERYRGWFQRSVA